MTNKTETWRKACRKLRDEGMIFEIFWKAKEKWVITLGSDKWLDTIPKEQLRIKQQPIHARPDWREWCKRLQDAGVRFEINHLMSNWKWTLAKGSLEFCLARSSYRIAQQPIPENIGDLMMEETKPDQKKEIPHRELQIQWHKDKLESLRNKAPMREWQFRHWECDWEELGSLPLWERSVEYRRKPKVETYEFYWCVVQGSSSAWIEWRRAEAELQDVIQDSPSLLKQLTPIKKETVEIEEE